MYTLITGGTGFLGKHLISLLIEQDRPIKVLTRSFDPELHELGVKQVIGDLLDKELLVDALSDVDRVYHLAGLVSRDPDDAKKMYAVHVDGTVALFDAIRQVDEAAKERQISKIVVASTSGTVAVSEDREFIGHDDSPYADGVVAKWPYYLSKIYAERVVDRYIKHFKLPIVTMRPTLLLGPGDDRGSSTEDVVSFLKGDIKAVPKGGISFVDVRDVASAFVTAMDIAPPGKKYLLGSTNMGLHSFFDLLASMTEKSSPIEIDERVVQGAATVMRRLRKFVGKEPLAAFDSVSIDMAKHYWYLDASRAKSELGWEPRTVESTLRDTIDWIYEYHDAFREDDRIRKTPPSAYVPKETLEYAERIRKV